MNTCDKKNTYCSEIGNELFGTIRFIRDENGFLYFCVIDLANVLMYRQVKWILEKYRPYIRKFEISNSGKTGASFNFINKEGAKLLVAQFGDEDVYEWLFGRKESTPENVSCETFVSEREDPETSGEPTLSLETCEKLLKFAKYIMNYVEGELERHGISYNEEESTIFDICED